jgi:hypothetical protein
MDVLGDASLPERWLRRRVSIHSRRRFRFEDVPATNSAMMTLDLTDDEKRALAVELKRTIAEDRYPLSPRIRTLQAILAKVEPPSTVARAPVPTSTPGDRPRAAVAARKRQRRG